RADARCPAVMREAVNDFLHDGGIAERGGTDLYRACACQQEFDRVFDGGNAAAADDGNIDAAITLIHHAHGNWFDVRPGQSAHDVAEFRLARLHVNGHAQHRIAHDQRVGAAG